MGGRRRRKDRYLGGPGRDRLWLQYVDAPDVRCGTGTDTPFVFNRIAARLHTDCERVESEGARVRIHRGAGRLRLELRWATRETFLPCRTWVNGIEVHGALSPHRARFVTLPRSERITLHATICHKGFGKYTDIIAFRLAL